MVLINAPTHPSEKQVGVTVESFAIIATMSAILSSVHIYKDALICARLTVKGNVEKEDVVSGNPVKHICKVSDIKNKIIGEEVYLWRYMLIEECHRMVKNTRSKIKAIFIYKIVLY